MSYVLLAHAADAQSRADRVAEKLRAVGFDVRAPEAARPRDDVEGASAVLVLWSRSAKAEERALTRAAQRAGKLTMARIEPVTPPVAGGVDLATWNGRETRAWSKLVSELQQKAPPKSAAKTAAKKAKPVKAAKAVPAPRAAAAPAKTQSFAMLSVGFIVVFATLLGAAALFTAPH
ncbi:MAG: hypothetical protein NW206_13410 [Hyphomonadaceae bacterium]|nr:hypothetical protein [Hyphomonadaceae bacterium]